MRARIDRSFSREDLIAFATLFTVVVAAAYVRALGIDFGRPFAYHPDEAFVAKTAMRMVSERDANPHTFLYPSLMTNIQVVVTAVSRLYGGGHLETGQTWLHESEVLTHQFRYFLAGRYAVLGLALMTLPVVYGIAARLAGRWAGVIAAAIVATSPLHIMSSRYIVTDILVTLLCAMVLLVTLHAARDGRTRWWILAGLLAGLAGSAKWTGIAVVGVPLLGYIMTAARWRDVPTMALRPVPVLIVGAAVVGLVIGTPALVFDFDGVRDDFVRLTGLYARVRPNERSNSFVFHAIALLATFGPLLLTASLVGLGRIIAKGRSRELPIVAYVVVHYVLISVQATHFERNLLPIVPYLAVAAAAVIVHLARRLVLAANRSGAHARPIRTIVAAGLTAALVLTGLAPGLAAGIDEGRRLQGVDTRTIAREWILANIPRKSIVAREQYTPQLTPDEYRLRNHPFLWNRNWDWYREVGVQYLITSSLNYVRFYRNPDAPAQDAFYRELFELREVFRVDPGPMTPGWTVRIFELSDTGVP